jgi:hypothetical protein
MTIDNHCGRDERGGDFPASQAEAHALIALEQSALYVARLAIARWINGSSDPSAPAPSPDPAEPRAAWYAQAQQNFQEWLGRGGFAQYDIACAEQFAPAMADFSEPVADRVPGSGTSPANSCVE